VLASHLTYLHCERANHPRETHSPPRKHWLTSDSDDQCCCINLHAHASFTTYMRACDVVANNSLCGLWATENAGLENDGPEARLGTAKKAWRDNRRCDCSFAAGTASVQTERKRQDQNLPNHEHNIQLCLSVVVILMHAICYYSILCLFYSDISDMSFFHASLQFPVLILFRVLINLAVNRNARTARKPANTAASWLLLVHAEVGIWHICVFIRSALSLFLRCGLRLHSACNNVIAFGLVLPERQFRQT